MPMQHRYRPNQVPVPKLYTQKALLNHDARNSLSVVLLTIEALQNELFGPLTTNQKEVLIQTHEYATHLQGLLESILKILVEDQYKRYQ